MIKAMKQARNAFVWNLNTDLDNIPACDQWAKMLRKNIDDLDKAIAELESQEPYAWVAEDVCEGQFIKGRLRKIWWECEKGVGTAIYTHPPQRTLENNT